MSLLFEIGIHLHHVRVLINTINTLDYNIVNAIYSIFNKHLYTFVQVQTHLTY